MNDPELEKLSPEPADRAVVDLLKASRPAAPPLDPHFHDYLRAKLMTEARRTLPARGSRSWFPFTLSPNRLAPAMAAVAVGFVVVLGVEIYLHGRTEAPQVAYNIGRIDKQTHAEAGEPIVIPFTGPVDKTAVAESVVMQPATSVTKQWVGQNLVIIPDHPLAPNTTYTVTFKPSVAAATPNPTNPASTPKPAPSYTPLVVPFTTVPAPVPPVVPPSYRSANVSYGQESRLADASTVFNGSWTAAGQLLVTRPAGQPAVGSSPSPSATATASGPAAPTATTDIWLMSALSTPIRLVVPGGNFPAAAPSGGVFAAWQVTSNNQVNLGIWELQGHVQGTLATADAVPDRAPVWIGNDRIAYVNQGRLSIVDAHGAQVYPRTIRVQRGSVAGSPLGTLLAVESVDGSGLIDLTPGSPLPLAAGGAGRLLGAG